MSNQTQYCISVLLPHPTRNFKEKLNLNDVNELSGYRIDVYTFEMEDVSAIHFAKPS